MEYRERYGSWAGDEKGRCPDFTHCAKSVPAFRGSVRFKQCTAPAKYDPGEDGKPTACGRHRAK